MNEVTITLLLTLYFSPEPATQHGSVHLWPRMPPPPLLPPGTTWTGRPSEEAAWKQETFSTKQTDLIRAGKVALN